ncbi:MerR family transcriptional regulator [Streptomyces corynorhini]|uniref:MerR family transcriptional regulator n=1 Tax=Streptomyces corynorhini TaxID=2282652 RepID=UPI0018F42E1C|nr:MerR family transcriptional regulator [Streptomyces corynorhini]
MRMAELSERSGVATATIKYYLREGLLRPGRRVSATQAEYDEDHLRRLRLVRALIQVGRMPVATAREVLVAVEDESLDRHKRIGAAVWALPHGSPGPAGDGEGPDEVREEATRAVDEALERIGWTFSRAEGDSSPAYRMLVDAVAGLSRTGYPCAPADLLAYARSAADLGAVDLDMVERYEPGAGQVEAAVALTVLYEPVLLGLRRLAEAEESNRRFGGGG